MHRSLTGCGFAFAGAAYYFPCAAWLWPEDEAEGKQLIAQPPSQNLAEALIPPAPVDLHASEQASGSRAGPSQAAERLPGPSHGSFSNAQPDLRHGSRQSKTRGSSSEGIELKPAASNPMLGQDHLVGSGRKLVTASVGKSSGADSQTRRW